MTDRDDQLAHLERVEACIRRMSDAVGDPDGCRTLVVEAPKGHEYVVVSAKQASETGSSITLMLRGEENAFLRDMERLEIMVRRTLRSSARRRAIGSETPDPAWSITVHAVIAAAIRHAGVDPLLLADETDEGRKLLALMLEDTPVSVSGLKTIAGHVEVDVAEVLGTNRMLLWSTATSNGIRLPDMLPETMLNALAGRMVSEVISHPALDAAGDVRILMAKNDRDGRPATVLVVEGRDVPLRPVPEAVAATWLDIPY